jgi:hypothetical protein
LLARQPLLKGFGAIATAEKIRLPADLFLHGYTFRDEYTASGILNHLIFIANAPAYPSAYSPIPQFENGAPKQEIEQREEH